jgi:outer membrane protein
MDMTKLPCFLSSVRFLILSLIIPYGSLFALQGMAWGEKPKGESILLSLPEIIQMAIANSPEIGGIRSEIAASKSDLDQVRGAYYPQLESNALVGPVEDAKEPLIVNGRITDPSPPLDASSIGIFGRLDLTATQPLYTFGKLSNRKEAASRGVKAKEFQIDQKKGQVVLKVKELYYALILAHAGVDLANESEGFYEEARRRIHRLLELKSPNATESDLYRIDAYRADAPRLKAQAEKGVKVAYFALKSMIRLPPGVEFDLTEKTLSMKKESLAGLESYLQEATAKRPEFKQLAEALAAQESQVKAATSDRYPSFFAALRGSLAGAPGREALYNRYIPDEFNHAYIGVVGGLKWNFDFGISRAKVDKMRAEYDKLLNTKAFAEMNIPIEVVKSYQENLEWREAASSYQQAATASRKWILSALTDFDMGVGTAYDMLNAIEKYGQNQGKYLEALLHFNLSLAELEYAVGMKTW